MTRDPFWHPITELPPLDRAICLCATNGKVLCDFFIWIADKGMFVGQTSTFTDDRKQRIAHDFIVKPADIQWWAYKTDLPPLPLSPSPNCLNEFLRE